MDGNRIFTMSDNGADVVRTEFVRFSDGSVMSVPDQAVGLVFPLSRAKARKVEINSRSNQSAQLRAISNLDNSVNKTKMNTSTPVRAGSSIQAARSTDGTLSATRLEKKGRRNQATKKIFLTLENKTAKAIEHIIFDGYNLNATREGIEPLPEAGFNVGGTFKTNTLVVLHLMSIGNPFRIERMHISSTTGDFIKSGSLKTYLSDISNKTQIDEVTLAGIIRPDQFQANIITIDDYRMLVDAFVGLGVTVAAGEKLTLTWEVPAVSEAYNMDDPGAY